MLNIYVGRPCWTPHVKRPMLNVYVEPKSMSDGHIERPMSCCTLLAVRHMLNASKGRPFRETPKGDPEGRPKGEKVFDSFPRRPLVGLWRDGLNLCARSRGDCAPSSLRGARIWPQQNVYPSLQMGSFLKKNCVFGYKASWKVDIREASGRFWSALRGRRSTKNRDACNKMEFLGYIGVCARGQMRHEKSTSVRQVFGPSAI